ncbi:hypothetical protein J2129_001751 [Methanofollis sp. W23]|nr:hypothetical protein [Methanofollis sp. W23]
MNPPTSQARGTHRPRIRLDPWLWIVGILEQERQPRHRSGLKTDFCLRRSAGKQWNSFTILR